MFTTRTSYRQLSSGMNVQSAMGNINTNSTNESLEMDNEEPNVTATTYYYRITKMWNDLPQSVVEAETINTFKNRLDKEWKNHPLKYNHKKSDL